MRTTFRTAVAGLAFSTAMVLGSAALAETVALKAELKASNEVPPVESKGSGTLTATYDTGSKSLNYTANYSGLSGDATAAHFHGPAAAGQNAGVAVPVTDSAATPIKGSATLTDAQATDLMAGRWYFNIHTAANKGGEIRGQVVKGK
ncbi:MAG TPA: CHRD domain-containing protein [Xanthobacteraceae bacterium]